MLANAEAVVADVNAVIDVPTAAAAPRGSWGSWPSLPAERRLFCIICDI